VRQSADRWLLCVRRSPVLRPRANQHSSMLALGELVRCSPSRSPALSASAPCVLAPSCARSWAPGRAWPSWFLCLRSFNSRLESNPSVTVRKFLKGGGGFPPEHRSRRRENGRERRNCRDREKQSKRITWKEIWVKRSRRVRKIGSEIYKVGKTQNDKIA